MDMPTSTCKIVRSTHEHNTASSTHPRAPGNEPVRPPGTDAFARAAPRVFAASAVGGPGCESGQNALLVEVATDQRLGQSQELSAQRQQAGLPVRLDAARCSAAPPTDLVVSRTQGA